MKKEHENDWRYRAQGVRNTPGYSADHSSLATRHCFFLIANEMRSPASSTNSKRATYYFLIANEFHLQDALNWLSPSLPTPGALARPSRSLATNHSSTLPALTQEGRDEGPVPLSNRYSKLLESPVTHTKQILALDSNGFAH